MLSKSMFIIISNILVVIVFRIYNNYRYNNKIFKPYDYYINVTNISLYPKNIDGLNIKYVDKGRFQGFHIIPDNKIYKGVVVCYGGSEGSPNFENAVRLARIGYETLAVFMFGMKNQPKTLVQIPLEQFEDVLLYINENIKYHTPITVLGVSKGAEYSLHLATKYKEISNLILISPSAYTFAGLDFSNYGSSWTYMNQELPFIDLKKISFFALTKCIFLPILFKSPVCYKEIYDSALRKDMKKYTKLIPAQNVQANILMITGEDDQMWGSYEMAKIIKNQNKKAELISYKNAGHIFVGEGVMDNRGTKIMIGGNAEGNNKANIDSIKVIDRFLEKNHPKL